MSQKFADMWSDGPTDRVGGAALAGGVNPGDARSVFEGGGGVVGTGLAFQTQRTIERPLRGS